MKGNYARAIEYFTKAAELGNPEGHYRLAGMYYYLGQGVEMDKGKYTHHLEEAAIAGHPDARYDLGIHEWNNAGKERAAKHWIIAATLGEDKSIKELMKLFKEGYVKKEDLASALRAHHAAVDATKSPERDRAEETVSE